MDFLIFYDLKFVNDVCIGNFVKMVVFHIVTIFPFISRIGIDFRPHNLNVKVPSLWNTPVFNKISVQLCSKAQTEFKKPRIGWI